MTKMMQWSPATTKRKTNNRKLAHALGGALALALTFGVPLAGLTAAPAAHAQKTGVVRRSVEGKVHDRNDAVIKGAVVYLKDTRTLAVKSFLSDEDGDFHFGQLSDNTDYELYAEYQGKRSKSKTISPFSSKSDFNFVLKIDTAA